MNDNEKLIELMRMIRDTRERELFEFNQNKNRESITVEEIRYVGEYEFVEQIESKQKPVNKNIFMLTEKKGSTIYLKFYDENMEFLGTEIITSNERPKHQILPSEKYRNQVTEMQEKLGQIDKQKGKTLQKLEETEKENGEHKKTKISNDLSIGEEDLNITYYRPIIDNVFKREFPNTCQGAEEVGMAYSETKHAYILVVKRDDKFEIAPGTEPATATPRKTVWQVDRKNESIEKEVPYATMPINGEGYKNGTKELSITIGQYGYIETNVVNVTRDNERVGKKIAEQGEGHGSEKSKAEQNQEDGNGIDNASFEIDLIQGRNSPAVAAMTDRIKTVVLEKYKSELEDLYRGNTEQINNLLEMEIKVAVSRGHIIEEDILQAVESNIEYDIKMMDRQHGEKNHP